jgi:hypothetical protein
MNRILLQSVGILVSLTLMVITGCGPDGPKIVKVEGTVTRGGKPVPNIALTMTPIAGGRPSWGMADESGKFKMQYTIDQDGAIVGKHRVSVEFPPSSPQEENDLAMGKKQRSKDQREIAKKYGDSATSPCQVEITDDGKPVTIALD